MDDREFSYRVASALDDEDFRAVLADRMVNELTRSVAPDVLAVRPLAVPALAALSDTPPFRRLFTRAIAQRHRALTNGESTFAFELPLGEGPVIESLRSVSPRVANAVPADLTVPVLRLDPREFELEGARLLVDLADWWWPLLIAAVLALIGCGLLAGGVRAAVVYVGAAIAGAGLLVVVGVAGLGEFVVSHAAHAADLSDEPERGAVRALWSALFGDLLSAALIAALTGTIVAALAAQELSTRALAATWERTQSLVRSPSPAARWARAVVLVALGATFVLEPTLGGRIVLVVAGGLLVLIGVAQVSGGARERPATAAPTAAPPMRVAAAVGAVVLVAGVALALVLPSPGAAPVESAESAEGCNGSAALCDRRLNEVVFPGTHNSYAAADEEGWFFANQRYGIARQLSDGIRAFLIDVHYGVTGERGRVRTDLAYEGSSRNKVVRQLSPEAVRAADRLAGGVGAGETTGRRRPYLCHTLCELGAEPVDEQLNLFRKFLDANPREVVILFIEPYVPVEEIERALEQADLLSEAAALQRDAPLPTLGDLVAADTRLVVLAEDDGGARPWYLDGFSFVQDTPLGATEPAELRCRRFRGSADSPLFMVNHWIPPFPPSVSRNEQIAGTALRDRLRRCQRSRRLLPNLLAVDFHERSGVVEVARQLNAQTR